MQDHLVGRNNDIFFPYNGFIVDSLLIGDTEDESESNIKDTNTVLKWIGFVVHEKQFSFLSQQNK
jgi:hypothetical protein